MHKCLNTIMTVEEMLKGSVWRSVYVSVWSSVRVSVGDSVRDSVGDQMLEYTYEC